MRRRGPRGERGSVVVEFIGLAVLLGLPLVYVLVSLAGFQAASFAAVSIADEASRARLAADGNDADAALRVDTLVRDLARGHGLDPDSIELMFECQPRCSGPGARVKVTVSVDVWLPLMPADARMGTVRATGVGVVPRFS